LSIDQEEAIRPVNPLWYLAALLLALGGWVGATVVAAGAWDGVRAADVKPLSGKISAENRTVAVFTDIQQPERQISCRATEGKNDKPTDVPAAGLDITVTSDGGEWHLIGLLPDAPPSMTLACTPLDKRVDNASYAYAAVDGFGRANTGRGIAALAAAVGAALAIWTFISRRRAKQTA